MASFADYFTFAFVRDPLDRFVSAWHDKVVDNNYYDFDPATHERMQVVEEFAAGPPRRTCPPCRAPTST